MRFHRDTQSSDSGFTLIELMVVVSIIAIVAAAVVPSFSSVLQRHRQREAAQLIIQGVFAARSEAARTGKCHRVRVIISEDPADQGGTGGAVAVDRADRNIECGQVENWTRVSYRSVGPSSDPLVGDVHAALIGRDIAITQVVAPPAVGSTTCNTDLNIERPEWMIFSPSSLGLYDLTERFFEVQAFNAAGTVTGVTQYVRVLSGGTTRYTLCER